LCESTAGRCCSVNLGNYGLPTIVYVFLKVYEFASLYAASAPDAMGGGAQRPAMEADASEDVGGAIQRTGNSPGTRPCKCADFLLITFLSCYSLLHK
jgi:hypothetical protein